ncbi:hypothetical protein [Desulfovibrio sp. SGI.169]
MADPTAILENLHSTNLDAGTVFSGTPSGKMVKGFTTPTLFTPVVDMLT